MRRSVPFILVAASILATAAPARETVFSVEGAWAGAAPRPGSSATLVVTVAVQEGWHVNSSAPLEEFLIPTRVTLDLPAGWTAGQPAFPRHRLATFAFSEGPVAVYEGTFEVKVKVRVAPDATVPESLAGGLEAQACNDTLCLAPEKVPFSVAVGGAPQGAPIGSAAAAADVAGEAPGGLSRRFSQGSLALRLLLVFLAGLALNLTPCVYPLIPITVSFFMAQRESGRGGWPLAIAYVLGMSVTYSVLGVAAALTGKLFGAALQSPWVVGAIVLVLLALAASMFGLWELRVPAWAARASGGRAGIGGALFMGLLVGLVAAPCIGPFVLGLLTYVGQQQDVVLGFLLFFTLSLGLGLPYLVLALSAGALDRLPNSGAWMVGVRQLFGVLLIALAGYFVQPFLPAPWSGGGLLGVLVAAGGLYLLVVARPGHEQPWVDRAMRLAAGAMLVFGTLKAPFPGHVEPRETLAWQRYDETAVEAALDSGRPVVLDFYADWCVPCKELDEKTFADPEVAARLAGFALFKVDLTASDERTEAIRGRFQVLGVPTIAFFNAGKEVAAARLTGFEPAARFLRRLDRIAAR